MGSRIDITNQTFGKLTALYPIGSSKRGIIWHCACSCGNTKDTYTTLLRSKRVQSCGCLEKEKWKETQEKVHKVKDLTGQHFGKLTVIKQANDKNYKKVMWECYCDCGNSCIIPSDSLLNKGTQSCGCLKSKGEEIIAKMLRENNVSFEQQKTFESCRFPDTNALARFDFYVEDKYIIEYDGVQHFEYTGGWNTEHHLKITQEHDSYKNQWCKDNNIPIIRIPYSKLNYLTIDNLLLTSTPS